VEGALDQKGTARMVQIQWPIARPCIIAESNHCLRLYVRSIIGQSMREKDCWFTASELLGDIYTVAASVAPSSLEGSKNPELWT
jgi:hypothetical protein